MNKPSTSTAAPKIRLPKNSAWAKGPPHISSTSSALINPAIPTSANYSSQPGALQRGASLDGVSLSRNNSGVIQDISTSISSTSTSTPWQAVKDVKFFGTIPAAGYVNATKSTTSAPKPTSNATMTNGSSTSMTSIAALTTSTTSSSSSRVPLLVRPKIDIHKFFQGASSTPPQSPTSGSDLAPPLNYVHANMHPEQSSTSPSPQTISPLGWTGPYYQDPYMQSYYSGWYMPLLRPISQQYPQPQPHSPSGPPGEPNADTTISPWGSSIPLQDPGTPLQASPTFSDGGGDSPNGSSPALNRESYFWSETEDARRGQIAQAGKQVDEDEERQQQHLAEERIRKEEEMERIREEEQTREEEDRLREEEERLKREEEEEDRLRQKEERLKREEEEEDRLRQEEERLKKEGEERLRKEEAERMRKVEEETQKALEEAQQIQDQMVAGATAEKEIAETKLLAMDIGIGNFKSQVLLPSSPRASNLPSTNLMPTTEMEMLSLIPPSTIRPYLSTAFAAFRFIYQTVQQVQGSLEQLHVLAYFIGQLLQVLDREYHATGTPENRPLEPLEHLHSLLNEVSVFIQREATRCFLKSLFAKEHRNSQIEDYCRELSLLVHAFQVHNFLDTTEWKSKVENARMVDQQVLNETLNGLEANQTRLAEMLNLQENNLMAIKVCLQRRLGGKLDGDRERQFLSYALRYLTTMSGSQMEMESWTITSYEVEFGHRIGFGGFGEVYKGIWNKTQVAIKVLKTECGITPSSMAIRREIATWSTLRHTHILQFLGANELDDRPFIVMPYMKNGSALDFIRIHPDLPRLPIIYHISLGLVYLHSQRIIHGDLKALNVLVDDGGNAVLCDFGLSRIKADVTSRIVKPDSNGVVGSRNWMAPERLLGGAAKKHSDIYSLGMTIYEIFTNETPLGELGYFDFIDLVAERNARPERPDDEDAPQLTDAVWELAEKCWVKDPKKRPTISTVCDILGPLLDRQPKSKLH